MLYEELNSRKKKLGMTTEQLSQLSGVPGGTINKILSGETKSPRYDTLRALENVLYGLNGESPELNSRTTESDIRALSRMTPDAVREAARPYYTKRQGEYTVEDYRALPEDVRAELIDGVLIFLEAPTFTHQELVMELLLDSEIMSGRIKDPAVWCHPHWTCNWTVTTGPWCSRISPLSAGMSGSRERVFPARRICALR